MRSYYMKESVCLLQGVYWNEKVIIKVLINDSHISKWRKIKKRTTTSYSEWYKEGLVLRRSNISVKDHSYLHNKYI